MAHSAAALLLVFACVGFFLIARRGAALVDFLFTHPFVGLWLATGVCFGAWTIYTKAWRSIDWGGLGYFVVVAVVAFTGLTLLLLAHQVVRTWARTRR